MAAAISRRLRRCRQRHPHRRRPQSPPRPAWLRVLLCLILAALARALSIPGSNWLLNGRPSSFACMNTESPLWVPQSTAENATSAVMAPNFRWIPSQSMQIGFPAYAASRLRSAISPFAAEVPNLIALTRFSISSRAVTCDIVGRVPSVISSRSSTAVNPRG